MSELPNNASNATTGSLWDSEYRSGIVRNRVVFDWHKLAFRFRILEERFARKLGAEQGSDRLPPMPPFHMQHLDIPPYT